MNNEDINILINDILNGTRDLLQFNKPEHAGVCSAGSLLIGALIVCDLARESLGSGSDASGSKTPPANWQIDEAQEQYLQRWAEAMGVWIPEAEEWLQSKYGPMMAQGAEASYRTTINELRNFFSSSEYYSKLSEYPVDYRTGERPKVELADKYVKVYIEIESKY